MQKKMLLPPKKNLRLPQDIANDELADPRSCGHLLAWHTITDLELCEVSHLKIGPLKSSQNVLKVSRAQVFKEETGPMVEAARHLIRWCLKGEQNERPTMAQVCANHHRDQGYSCQFFIASLISSLQFMRLSERAPNT